MGAVVLDLLVWGTVATLAATVILELGQGVGWTRLSLPFLLGTAVSPRRHTAYAGGFALSFASGLAVAAVYGLVFATLGTASLRAGLVLGVLHGLVILAVMLPLLPHVHPRVASDDAGPTPRRRLEPPGFLGLNYGRPTPAVVLASTILFGGVLGAFVDL